MIVQAPDNKTIDFGDMPPDQVTAAMQKMYPPTQAAPEQSFGQQLGHQLGLTGRYLTEGAMAIPTMAAEAAAAPMNLGVAIGNKITGGKAPFVEPAQDVQGVLNKMGFPQPQGQDERLIGDVGRGAASAGGGLLQMLSGALGGGAAGATREAGGGPLAQTAAGLVAGIVPGALAVPAAVAANATKSAFQPFTNAGRQNIVGNTLNTAALDPQAAMRRLGEVPEYIPGSKPTTAEASGDYGLIALQKGVKNENSPLFADRASQQNAARNILLNDIAKTPEELAAAKVSRDTATGPMREQAFANQQPAAISPEDAMRGGNGSPIAAKLNQILSSPSGSRQTVDKAISWVKGMIGNERDPVKLYEIRKDVNDALQGKFRDSEKSDYRLAAGQLKQALGVIDDTIEASAPGYKKYMQTYAEQSKPINQMETLQDVKSRTMLSAPDVNSGHDFISQPKWSNVVQANRDDLAKVLNKDQMSRLDAITQDLDRGATLNNAAIKPAGADTYQNLSIANFLGASLGKASSNPFMKTIGRPLAWLYKLPDEAINKLITDAMLDPMLARQLMQKAKPNNVELLGRSLKEKAMRSGFGSLMGTSSTVLDTKK